MKYEEVEKVALLASQEGWEIVLVHQEGEGHIWQCRNSNFYEFVIQGFSDTESKTVALMMAIEQIP